MQDGVLNQGTVDAVNLVPDPLSTNPALYRSTGSLGMATVGGVTAVKATATTSNVLEMVIDKRFYSDVEGFRVGDTVYWSAEVYVTTPMTVQATVSFYAGGNEDTTAALTPQVPADGWVRHYAKSVITAAPAGSYFDYRIRPQQLNIPVGQGFLFRNMIISKNKEVPFFSGSTPDNLLYDFEWSGPVNNSASVRRLPANADVLDLKTRVLVNGIQREILSWSADREIANDLPAQVTGGSGVSQATGSIEWASKDIQDGSLNPWNPSTGWIPAEGDRVDIYVGDGVTEWKQFTGVIDKTTGSIGGGLQSTIVDHIDRLSAVVNIPALMTGMPPLTVGGAWRRVGMSSLFTQNTLLRKAGFYSTPRPEFGCVLDVPLISSNWPLIGEVTSCAKRSDANSAPDGHGSVWGGARADYTAIYTPSTARDISVPLQITLLRASAHNGFGYVRVEYGSATKSVELHITATAAAIRVNNATVTSVPCSGDTVCQLLHKSGVITLKTSQGQSVTVTAPTGATGPVTRIVSAADAGARVAGMQVSHPTATQYEFASLAFEPTALVIVGGMHTGSMILPAISESTAREALEEIGEHTLRAMWIDETGKAQIVASDVLYERLPSQQITTLDDIRELSWERNLLSVRSEVRVSYSQPAVTARTAPAVEAWRSSESVVLGSNETHEVIIEPAADEDWIMPDTQWEVLGRMFFNDMNKGIGSVCGGVLTDGASEVWASEPANDVLTVTVSGLAANKFVLRHTTSTLPAGKQVELRTLSANFVGATGLWPYQWDQQMPTLKAYAVAKWTTVERTPTVAGTHGPVLEHDCGKWITGHDSAGNVNTAAVDALASFLAMQVTNPAPFITGMSVGYDPRRQLGDVITVSSPNLMGVELRCLIVGINNSAGSSGYEQSLSVRVISAETTFTTYGEFVDAWGDTADYNTFIAAWESTSTYANFNNDPLRGTA